MKKLSTYLFLIFFSFQTLSLADDITDFQVEGMSVGDSLLDYFSKEEIKNNGLVFQAQVAYLIPIFGVILGYLFLNEGCLLMILPANLLFL